MAELLSTDQQDARLQKNWFLNQFPGIEKMRREAEDFGKVHLYVDSLFGRRVDLSGQAVQTTDQKLGHQALGLKLHASESDIFKYTMVTISEALTQLHIDVNLVLQNHDELVYEVLELHAAKVANLLKCVVEFMPKEFEKRFKAKLKFGKNLAEMNDFK